MLSALARPVPLYSHMINVSSTFQWFGDRVLNAVLGDIDARMVTAGNQWLSISRSLAPVRTGELRAREDFQVVDHTLVLILGAPWDVFQEFGTRTLAPRPHVRPALAAIGRTLGFDVEMHFNRPGGSTWGGIHATEGGFVVPKGLTRGQRLHVQRHLVPMSQRLHRGNVKRAKVRVRRFE